MGTELRCNCDYITNCQAMLLRHAHLPISLSQYTALSQYFLSSFLDGGAAFHIFLSCTSLIYVFVLTELFLDHLALPKTTLLFCCSFLPLQFSLILYLFSRLHVLKLTHPILFVSLRFSVVMQCVVPLATP